MAICYLLDCIPPILISNKSQKTNKKSQMTNSFRIYNQPNTGKNYLIYYAWMPEQNHRGGMTEGMPVCLRIGNR
jgi:hypothetical protein